MFLAGRMMEKILSGVCLGMGILHLGWESTRLAFSKESRGEGSSKKQKVMELPLLGGVLVLDALVGLTDDLIQLQEEVNQHGKLIIARLEVVPGMLKEERIYPEQDPEESN